MSYHFYGKKLSQKIHLAGSNYYNHTVVPHIDTPEACEERGGSRWQNGQCWDYQHDPKW
ncbi:MAG: hypothetical protein QNJ60_15405 [Xenococcaceae cyanobacterium MO_188.B19]|nr:hypothetical protein [Xenococcaceae cyanobacterium MO_188.B19]